MNLPPSLLRVRVQNSKRRLGLWLPLFLVWPPVVLFALALFPFVLVLAALLWRKGWGRPVLLAGPTFFRLFCALRGLVIDVEDASDQVYIAIK